MEKILIDTDVFIDFLRGHKKRILDFFKRIDNKELVVLTTILNVIELYSGEDIKNKNKLFALEKVLSHFQIIFISLSSAKLAGSLRLKYKLGLTDAVIAACTIESKAKLFTFNLKDFGKIKELEIFKTL